MTKGPATRRSFSARPSDPRLWIGLASAALVTWYALRTMEGEPGPGPLSSVHAALPELRGSNGCAGCHGVGALGDADAAAAMGTACAKCHMEIGAQLSSGRGFHGTLTDGGDCARCHGEHLGRDFEPSTAHTFALAGFASRAAYDHRGLDFGLAGAHERLACAACHPHADATAEALAALRSNQEARALGRFLGLSQACTTCHEDAHAGRLGTACADCHGQERPFAEAALFVHTEAFPLAGAHAGHACVACHAEGSGYAIEAYGGDAARAPTAERSCAACHASPHGVAFVEAAGSTCATCHAAEPHGFARADVERSRAAHAATGFALADAHAEVTCDACHAPSLPFAERHPGRAAGACALCHADPHGGQFGAIDADAALCARCHTAVRFAEHSFDAAAHAAAGFALDGAHAAAACSACHVPARPGEPPRYRGTPRACASCHDDVHRGVFDRPEVDTASGAAHGPGAAAPADASTGLVGCARCHVTTSFADVAAGRFDHDISTGFPLRGAHEQTRCAACHGVGHMSAESSDGAGRVARRLGAVADVFPGPFDQCATCHENPHGARYDVHAPDLVDGRVGCARCHGEASFRALLAFDHAWTGFALAGVHEALACAACHAPMAPDATGRIRGAAAGTACADCHADPHGGQFAAAGATDCARCHTPSGPFAELTFDHARDSRFALDEVHARLDCAACHRSSRTRDGREFVRYRPLGVVCADCHSAQPMRR